MTHSLYDEVRTSENLFSAWRHVKRSALSSKNFKIRGEASEFEHQHQRHLKTIQTQLRQRKFVFDDFEGVLKDKTEREAVGKAPRPIAIGSIKNRVVQRAILQVIQPRKIVDASNPFSKHVPRIDERLGKLNRVNSSRYGIGGLMAPYGGVKPGIQMILDAMHEGATHFFQSDIKAFFTAIPTEKVIELVRAETDDDELTKLFDEALIVNLANREELAGYADIFPKDGTGVAQGSSLSAFAGNVLLYDLDHELNELSVTAVRYIDDVFMLGASKADVDAAVQHAKQALNKFGFSLYKPVPGSTKAAEGECKNSFTFLGCTIQPNRCVPSRASKIKILSDVRERLSKSKKEIEALINGNSKFDPTMSRSATIDSIGKKIFGWQKSFSFCTSGQVFAEVDSKVAQYVSGYDAHVRRLTRSAAIEQQMKALGIPSTEQMFQADRS